jgi:hypothetical protein
MKLQRGDWVMRKTFFGYKCGVVNKVSEDGEYFLYHPDYVWTQPEYMFMNCKLQKSKNWTKLL